MSTEADAAGSLDSLTNMMADMLIQEESATPLKNHTTMWEDIWTGELKLSDNTILFQPGLQQILHCTVRCRSIDGQPEVIPANWPSTTPTQLMPKFLLGKIDRGLLKDSKMLIFRPIPGEALDALTKIMSSGYAACVHFSPSLKCNIKIIILVYEFGRQAFLGFIPNNQQMFINELREVILECKLRQGKH